MGIKGLFKFISEHKDQVCCPLAPLKGKLLVDGYSILHEIYTRSCLEWSTGGCYDDQHRATLDFYDTLIKAGVEPIDVLDGADSKDDISDTIDRRNGEINGIPGEIRNRYEHFEDRGYRDHYFPVLAKQVYKASLKLVDGVEVTAAEKKAYWMLIPRAYHPNCPVLTNNTNYCLPALSGGVALMHHFDLKTCSAPVYLQSKLVEFLQLRSPDLLYAIAAIMGENNRPAIRNIYHGRARHFIERAAPQPLPKNRPFVMNIADYLRGKKFRSFEDFEDQALKLDFGRYQGRPPDPTPDPNEQLQFNCLTVREKFIDKNSQCERGEIANFSAKNFPQEVISQYKQGNYPEVVFAAVSKGQCILDIFVGDPDQPPVSKIGESIREVMYGLVMNKMEERWFRTKVEEYYRSDTPTTGEKPWEFTAHVVKPNGKFKALNILTLDEKKRKEAGEAAICEVLESPVHAPEEFDSESPYVMTRLTLLYWGRHLQRKAQPDPPTLTTQIIKALLVNLLIPNCCDKNLEQDLYFNPMWIKVYHAFLEWQVLYRDVCSLNCMLFCPLVELQPTNMINGSAVIKLALNPDPDVFATLHDQMDDRHIVSIFRIQNLRKWQQAVLEN